MLTEYLISTNRDLGDDLQTSCDKIFDVGNSLRKRTDLFVKRTAYAMGMLKWKYEKDIVQLEMYIARLNDEIQRMKEDDDVVERNGRGGEFVRGGGREKEKG